MIKEDMNREDLYDLSQDLELDSDKRLRESRRWQKRFTIRLLAVFCLVLVAGLVYIAYSSSRAAHQTESETFSLTVEKIEEAVTQTGTMTMEQFQRKYGQPVQTSYQSLSDEDTASLIYDNRMKDDVLRMALIYFKRQPGQKEYVLEWASYTNLSSKRFSEDPERPFSMTEDDYASMEIGKTIYPDARKSLGLPNRALLSRSSDYSQKLLELVYGQDEEQQVSLIFEETSSGSLILKSKRENLWGN